MHSADLIHHIRENPVKLTYLYQSGDSRAVFIEAFLCKLRECNDTTPIVKAKCAKGHEFKSSLKKVTGTMFNIFAQNIIRETNDKIHAERKRSQKKSEEVQKRDQCKMKERKVKSQS